MDDDLKSSGALAVLFDLAKPLRAMANRLDRGEDAGLPGDEISGLAARWLLLRHLAGVLGLRQEATAMSTRVSLRSLLYWYMRSHRLQRCCRTSSSSSRSSRTRPA